MERRPPAQKGRGTSSNPKNRFTAASYELLEEEIDPTAKTVTRFYRDASKSALVKNDSPDIGFTFDLNPYRGCEHGCIYCYARPTHEYLGFSAGLDFESKIMVKPEIRRLLEEELGKGTWKPSTISLSGNTDCYQPAEQRLRLTRACLEVLLEFRNPVGIITKNALVLRDIDLLTELAKLQLTTVTLSITTLDKELHRLMEPRTSAPEQRLKTIEALAAAGIPVGVSLAPVIPGLNDSEIPAILKRAADHGATFAFYSMVRLPHAVKDLFTEWLHREYPDRAEKVINRIKEMRGGAMHSSTFGERMTGKGEVADSIAQLFALTCIKYGLNRTEHKLRKDLFVGKHDAQIDLFG